MKNGDTVVRAIVSTTRAAKRLRATSLVNRICSGSSVDGCILGAAGTRGKWFLLVVLADGTPTVVSSQRSIGSGGAHDNQLALQNSKSASVRRLLRLPPQTRTSRSDA